MILIWILLIAWGLWLLLPHITRWLMRMLGRRMQKQMLKNMGIDPSSFDRREYKGGPKAENQTRYSKRRTHARRAQYRKIIPSDYGDYISFTELTLTGSEAWLDGSASPVFVEYNERQITDIRWEEIK